MTRQGVVALLLAFTIIGSHVDARARVQTREPGLGDRIVMALAGRWTLTGTVEESSSSPAPFTIALVCRRTALGSAVDCVFSGRLPGVGPMEASALIGYRPDDGQVYWMEISSTGEYHAHRGVWNGDTIEFEPLTFVAGGATSVERLSLKIPSPGALLLRSTTTTGATTSSIEARGTRRSARRVDRCNHPQC